jgi:hypothetical protein
LQGKSVIKLERFVSEMEKDLGKKAGVFQTDSDNLKLVRSYFLQGELILE